MVKSLCRLFYSLWYGVEFETGYTYRRIKHSTLATLTAHHYVLIGDGWERFTDVGAGLLRYWCWYRKPAFD